MMIRKKNVIKIARKSVNARVNSREAINNAIAEEMRLDGDVFLMGEEVGEYQGAYKVSQAYLRNLERKE